MLKIAEKDILNSLTQDNPWWKGVPTPRSHFSHTRAYYTGFRDIALHWTIRRTVILMGPRRVGKTVMLHQLIHDAIQSGLSPQNILFASVDTPLYSGIPLETILSFFESQTGHNPSDRRLVIFDEIQYLKNWEVHLKTLTDRFPNTRFVASGSAAAALRRMSQESGAGRFTDYFLPPLTFSEFLDFTDLEKILIRQVGNGRFVTTDIHALNKSFLDYLNFGGYPEAVLNPDIRKDPHRFLGRDIIDKVLLRDLPSLYGIQDIQELNRLFTTIAYHSGQEISLDGLASSSGVAKNTLLRYLEYLEAAFLIVRVRRVDDSGKTFQRMRHFKVYLTNPSMRAALFAPLTEDDEAMGYMAETAIFSQWFHSEKLSNIHYARWKSGRQEREVDIVRTDPATLLPVWGCEIKWSDRYVAHPEDLKGLIEFAKNNSKHSPPLTASTRTLTSETVIDGITIKHFPCALYCYQIGCNMIEGHMD